jgi:hypothetical protein
LPQAVHLDAIPTSSDLVSQRLAMFQLPILFASIHRVAIRINEYFAVYHEFLMTKMCEIVLILRLRSDGGSI